jgi:hypothetical protein
MSVVIGSKRSCAAVTEDDEDLVIISLGKGVKFLSANGYVLRCYSMCARYLPPEATVWDLSSLLVEGHPPSYDVVATWLDVLHMVHEGDTTREEQIKLDTLEGVCQLLAFADAVGSSRGIIRACLRVCNLQNLVMLCDAVQEGASLLLDGRCYTCPAAGGSLVAHHMGTVDSKGLYIPLTSNTPLTAEQRAQLVTTLCEEMERAAYLGHKLQLQPLQRLVANIISSSMLFKEALLYGHLKRVFTPRVREAAGLADDEAFSDHLKGLTDVPLLPTATSPGSLLLANNCKTAELLNKVSTVPIKLQRAFLDAPPGQIVDVQLRLKEGCVNISGLCLPVDLVLRPKARPMAATLWCEA